MHRGEELLEKNLRPSFKSGRTSIGVFAYIARRSRSRLWLVRKRAESERITPRYRLGLNASQFARELYKPYIIPFIRSLSDEPNYIYFVVDGTKDQRMHNFKENVVTRSYIGRPTL
jgi:hypothetical protein